MIHFALVVLSVYVLFQEDCGEEIRFQKICIRVVASATRYSRKYLGEDSNLANVSNTASSTTCMRKARSYAAPAGRSVSHLQRIIKLRVQYDSYDSYEIFNTTGVST